MPNESIVTESPLCLSGAGPWGEIDCEGDEGTLQNDGKEGSMSSL